jgi:hypothetical protein
MGRRMLGVSTAPFMVIFSILVLYAMVENNAVLDVSNSWAATTFLPCFM